VRARIDAAGRVVIPKYIRDRAGLISGAEIDVRLRDGRVEIETVMAPKQLVEDDGILVVRAEDRIPPVTTDQVRDLVENLRR
jgi:AbrB family looped-hinge helix DNA binding protein